MKKRSDPINQKRLIAVQNGHTVINILNRKWLKKSHFQTVASPGQLSFVAGVAGGYQTSFQQRT